MNATINGSLFEEDEVVLLKDLNDEELEYLLPAVVLLFAVSMFGIPANIFTIIFYRKGSLNSNYKLFIVTVASIDVLSCCTAIPLENTLLLLGYAKDSKYESVCKLSRFCDVFMTFSSGFVLTLIAIERYRKICKPFNTQLTPAFAQKLCVVAVILGVLVSWPSLLIWGKKTLTIKFHEHEITAIDCAVSDDSTNSKTGFIYLVIVFVLAVFLITLVSVLYCLVGYTIKRKSVLMINTDRISIMDVDISIISHQCAIKNDKEKNETEGKENIEMDLEGSAERYKTSIVLSNDDLSESTLTQTSTSVQIEERNQNRYKTDDNKLQTRGELQNKTIINRASRTMQRRAHASQTSRVMFIISAIYVVSYIPNLIILTLESIVQGFYENQTSVERSASNFFVRLYFLNCGINPFVYALCDSSLRSATKSFLISLKLRLWK